MLILLSSEKKLENESRYCNLLFEKGLQCLHLRKPDDSKTQVRTFLSEIETKHIGKVVLHQYHDLANDFRVKGIHFTEKAKELPKAELKKLVEENKALGFSISGSFHSLSDTENYDFDYYFLSPVFNSISKANYKGQYYNVSQSTKRIIALGGVQSNNIKQAFELGFSGVAALGSIWQNENPLQAFQKLKSAFDLIKSKDLIHVA